MYFRSTCVSLFVFALCISAAAKAMEAGFQTEQFEDSARKRSVLIDWWYPVEGQLASPFNYGLGRGQVVESGNIAKGTFPLVVLSHGAMGAARNYSWIAEALARAGYVVAGISHFGESYAHGPDTVDPSAVLRSWERSLDVSAALSYAESRSIFSESIDMHRIGFIGHSSGGATAINLAGVLFDGRRIAEYCISPESVGDRGCDYARSSTTGATDSNSQPRGKSYKDRRITAFVALDPALGPGFFDYSSVDPTVKMLVVGSVENDFLPFRHHAERIANEFPNAQSHWLSKGESHFIYLNECDMDLEANGVPLCIDRQGVSRQAVHDNLNILIRGFFNGSFGIRD